MTGPALPAGTWDTHVHAFDPARFAYVDGRSYTPGAASASDLAARHRQWGVAHTVLVQPSVYGTDNSCLLDALARLGPSARAVAVVDPDRVSEEALADMREAGVAGLRVNLVSNGGPALDDPFSKTAAQIAGSGMFLQVYAPLARILQHAGSIETAEVPVVLDHFAGVDVQSTDADIDELCRRAADAPIWIKLSADYRLTPDGADPEACALRLIDRFWRALPDRLIWGSDWPHTGGGADRKARGPGRIEPFRRVESLSVPRLLKAAGLTDADCARVLAGNPATLFAGPDRARSAARQ